MITITGIYRDFIKNKTKQKQEVHGKHRSTEKQFQLMNKFLQSCDYTITLIKREKKPRNIVFEN